MDDLKDLFKPDPREPFSTILPVTTCAECDEPLYQSDDGKLYEMKGRKLVTHVCPAND